jgi:PPOX class probable F420-dependent enzyme
VDGDTARRLLATARVARLGTADARGRPHLVVVTFAVDRDDGDLVYTAVDQKPKTTRELERVRNVRENPRVALLADHYEEDWRALWWVRADGVARIGEAAELPRGVESLREKYPQYRDDPPQGPVIEVRVERWVGWSARPP